MKINAYAKINLFLDILGRRADGYHTITGVMQSVSLCDEVSVTVEEAGTSGCDAGIYLTCSHPALPTDRTNLGWWAAEAFLQAAAMDISTLRVIIHIEKKIPFAAGMAGGSTDAAAVLRCLNHLCGQPLTPAQLSSVGLSLGADVPFCLSGGTMMTEGVGELLTPVAAMPDCHIVVACAGEGVSTPGAYRALDEMYGNFDPTVYRPRSQALAALLDGLSGADLGNVGAHMYNIFESAILPRHTMAGSLRAKMLSGGALSAMMSGSGPSVFGLFSDGMSARHVQKALEAEGVPAWLCRPVGGEMEK